MWYAHSVCPRIVFLVPCRIGATINVLSPACVDLVTSVHFTPSDARTKAAHAALDALHTEFRARGYFSYRCDLVFTVLILCSHEVGVCVCVCHPHTQGGLHAPGFDWHT